MLKNYISISDKLRDIRTYYGYTQKYISDYLNIDDSNYTDYETYRRIIPLKHLNNLSNFYNTNIDYLLGLTENQYKTKRVELDKNFIGNNLKNIRNELNLKLIDFAKKINKSKTAISDYETGKRFITTATLYDIAKVYNISIDYILGKSNNKFIN